MNQVERINKKDLKRCEALGQGHYGRVERWIDTRNNRDLAIKYCTKGTHCDNQKLQEEAEKVLNFQHDNIIRLFGFVVDDDAGNSIVAVAFEFMAGGNLSEAMQKLKSADKHLPWSLKCRLMSEVSQALSYMHSKNYVHKDVKATNILLTTEFHGKLADLELSRGEQTNDVSTGSSYGTLTHLAPEYLEDVTKMSDYDLKVDMYSLGVTMYEIMSEEESVYRGNPIGPVIINMVAKNRERPNLSHITDRSDNIISLSVVERRLIPLMQECWSHNPRHRPTSKVVADELSSIYNERVKAEARVDAVWCATDGLAPQLSRSDFVSDGGQKRNVPAAVIPPATIINNPGNVNIGTSHTAVYGGGGVQPRPRTWVQLSDEEAEQKLDLRANAIVLQNEEANVSDDHLRKIAKFLGNDTKWLARCLLFKEGEVQAIEYDNQINGLEEINMQMLLKWKARTNTPSYKWLATACLSLNRTDLTNILVQEV